jgi:hypothetical protein
MSNSYQIEETRQLIQAQKVSHVLHLILSIITCGLWLIIWVLVTVSASVERGRLNRKMKAMMRVRG